MGVFTLISFLWVLEKREKLIKFYEGVLGARIHGVCIRLKRLKFYILKGLLDNFKIIMSDTCD
jgi:NADH:ubiquinone oxidoreductase subunit D